MTTTDINGIINLTTVDANGPNSPIEGAAYRVYGELYDVSGTALVKANITAFTATVVNESDGSVVLASTDINDANNCTLTDSGGVVNYSWINTAAAVTANTSRIIQLEWTYSGGVAPGKAELRFTVLEDSSA